MSLIGLLKSVEEETKNRISCAVRRGKQPIDKGDADYIKLDIVADTFNKLPLGMRQDLSQYLQPLIPGFYEAMGAGDTFEIKYTRSAVESFLWFVNLLNIADDMEYL